MCPTPRCRRVRGVPAPAVTTRHDTKETPVMRFLIEREIPAVANELGPHPAGRTGG